MKLRKSVLGLALLAASALAPSSFAADGTRVELHVPFSFVVAGTTMPAGAYELSQSGDLFYVRGAHASFIISSLPTSYDSDEKQGLIFRRHGGTAYLVGVQMSDESRAIPVHTAVASLASH